MPAHVCQHCQRPTHRVLACQIWPYLLIAFLMKLWYLNDEYYPTLVQPWHLEDSRSVRKAPKGSKCSSPAQVTYRKKTEYAQTGRCRRRQKMGLETSPPPGSMVTQKYERFLLSISFAVISSRNLSSLSDLTDFLSHTQGVWLHMPERTCWNVMTYVSIC